MRGNSIVRYCGESYDRIVLVGGFSKSYSSLAAFVACPTELKNLLKTAAPPYLYSGPSPIASLATVLAGLRRQRGPRRRDPRRPLAKDRPGAPVPRSAGRPHAESFRLPDHRGSARAPRGHRRGGTLPLRSRRLRDPRRLPARAEERGRVPDPGHGGQHRRPRSSSSIDVLGKLASTLRAPTLRPTGIRRVRLLAGIDWRGRAWIIYLAVGGLLTAALPLVPAAEGERPAHQPPRPLLVGCDRGRHLPAPAEGARRLAAHHRRTVPLLRRRPLHLQLPEALRRRRRVPVARRRHLSDRLPGSRRGAAPARATAEPARRPRRRDRLAHPHGRYRTALLGLPRRSEHPPLRADAAREGCVRRLSARRHPAARRSDPPRGRQGKRAPAFYLLVGSIVSLLAVDSAYTYALLTDAYNHQLSYDVGWIAYYLLWGAAALHPSMRTLEEPAHESRARLTPLRLGLLAGACLIAPGVRFYAGASATRTFSS